MEMAVKIGLFLQIPISTLNAVNELLQGIGGGTFGASG